MGRARGGLTSKIHALVDAEGRPVTLRLTGGQVHDSLEAEALIENIDEGDILLADKGYDSNARRAIKGDFRRTLAETEAGAGRTLSETQRKIGETDARSCGSTHDD